MSSASCDKKEETLAAYLLCLRPGDPCPCCGAGLYQATSRGRSWTGRAGLVCVECGCELTEVRLPFEHEVRRVLSPAA